MNKEARKERREKELLDRIISVLEFEIGDIIKATKLHGSPESQKIKIGETSSGILSIPIMPNVMRGIKLEKRWFLTGLITSEVKAVIKFATFWVVKTENSTYTLEKMGKVTDITED